MNDEKFENEYMRYLQKTIDHHSLSANAVERFEDIYKQLGEQNPGGKRAKSKQLSPDEPQAFKRNTARFTRPVLGGLVAVLICALLLITINTVNPAFTESIPVLGKSFQSLNGTYKQVNTNTKSPMGTNLDTYELSRVNVQMTPQAETDYNIEISDIYSDGEYVHASMIMHMPAGTGEEYANFSVEGAAFADGVECESGLFKGGGISRFEPGEVADTFIATIASKLPRAYEDSAEIDFDIALNNFYGIHLDDSIDTELRRAAAEELGLSIENGEAADLPFLGLDADIPAFTVEVNVPIDTSKNIDFDVSAEGENGCKIYHVRATPTYTVVKIDSLGFFDGNPLDLRLFTQDGTEIMRNMNLLGDAAFDAILEKNAHIAHEYGFDGMPNGTTSLTFRWADYYQKVYAEFTVDLENKTAEATEFYKDESSPLYPFNPAKFSHGTWSLMDEFVELKRPPVGSSGLDENGNPTPVPEKDENEKRSELQDEYDALVAKYGSAHNPESSRAFQKFSDKENEFRQNFPNRPEHWQNGFNLYDINIKNNDGSGYVDFRLGKQDGYRAVNIQILSGDKLIVSGDSFDGVKTTEYYVETGFFDEREEGFDSDSTHYSLRLHYQAGAMTSNDKNITLKVFDKETEELLYEKTVELTFQWIPYS